MAGVVPATPRGTSPAQSRQVRRRPLGRTMVDICLDLGVVPGFCTGAFWNHLFEIMQCLGGSVATLMREKTRRGEAFAHQPESSPESNRDWRVLRRDVIRQVLGFFIGEPPVDPFAQSPASCAPATRAALTTPRPIAD
jgi:hypothetical protein